MAASNKGVRRLQKEFHKLKIETPLEWASVSLVGDDITSWIATVKGPKDSPYENGLFQVELKFPDVFPMKPPAVRFITKIYHPSVSMKANGQICQDVVEANWSPVLTVQTILERIQAMMIAPTADSPLEADIGEVFTNDRKKFNATAKEWTKKFAS